MIVRGKHFSGGYRFGDFLGKPKARLIEAAIPGKVIIPLRQGFGNEVPPVIKKGDSVKAGQIIGIHDESVSTPVHSSVNGVVVELRDIVHLKGNTKAVVIESDGTKDITHPGAVITDWRKLSAEEIEGRLYHAGVTSQGRSGIPGRYRSSVIEPSRVEHLIVYGMDSGAYHSSFAEVLTYESMKRFVEGLRILRRVMPDATIHVALDKAKKTLLKQMHELVKDISWIILYPLASRYPQESDEVLVTTILNKRFPFGFLSANIGIIVLDVQAIIHVYDAVADGKPLVERVIALCGPGFSENAFLRVRVGTPISDVVLDRVKDGEENRIILNNSLTGETVTDLSLPVERTISGIVAVVEEKTAEFLAFAKPGFSKDSYTRTFASSFLRLKRIANTNLHGEERPCIFCGFCDEVCPVGIVPHLIYRHVEHGNIDERLIHFRIYNCIDCNLCSYVCPSKIGVAQYIREGKNKLIQMELDQSSSLPPDMELVGMEKTKGQL